MKHQNKESTTSQKPLEIFLNESGFAKKFENYMHRGFYSLASPIWSNFGRKRGLPISCFGSYIPDTMEGILEKVL
jgi:ribonucleoside-diphosphate reductase alpha chain